MGDPVHRDIRDRCCLHPGALRPRRGSSGARDRSRVPTDKSTQPADQPGVAQGPRLDRQHRLHHVPFPVSKADPSLQRTSAGIRQRARLSAALIDRRYRTRHPGRVEALRRQVWSRPPALELCDGQQIGCPTAWSQRPQVPDDRQSADKPGRSRRPLSTRSLLRARRSFWPYPRLV